MRVPIEECIRIAVTPAEDLQHHLGEVVGMRCQAHLFIRKGPQHCVPLRLLLVVEEHVMLVIDAMRAADDAAALPVLDEP